MNDPLFIYCSVVLVETSQKLAVPKQLMISVDAKRRQALSNIIVASKTFFFDFTYFKNILFLRRDQNHWNSFENSRLI